MLSLASSDTLLTCFLLLFSYCSYTAFSCEKWLFCSYLADCLKPIKTCYVLSGSVAELVKASHSHNPFVDYVCRVFLETITAYATISYRVFFGLRFAYRTVFHFRFFPPCYYTTKILHSHNLSNVIIYYSQQHNIKQLLPLANETKTILSRGGSNKNTKEQSRRGT